MTTASSSSEPAAAPAAAAPVSSEAEPTVKVGALRRLSQSFDMRRWVMVLLIVFACVYGYNNYMTPMPIVPPSYSTTEFNGNGFVGGVVIRASYPFRKLEQYHITTIWGSNIYYYKMGGDLFRYDRTHMMWVQVK